MSFSQKSVFALLCLVSSYCLADSFQLSDLLGLVNQGKVQKIEDVIGALPDSLRSKWIVMNSTRSAQPATPHHPRIILYSENLMLGFNGDPSAPGYQNLEAIQYHPELGQYEFRRLSFPRDAGLNQPPTISERNPQVCAQCHTTEYRPNWASYSNWVGALPSEFEIVNTQVSPDEKSQLEDFFQVAKTDPRYSKLKNLDYQTYLTTAGGEVLENDLLPQHAGYIAAWLERQIKADSRIRYASAAALADCPNINDFVPASFVSGGKAKRDALYNDTLTYQLIDQGMEADETLRAQNIVTDLRYLFETRNISIRALSYYFDTPYAVEVKSPFYLTEAFSRLGALDSELATAIQNVSNALGDCSSNYYPSQCTAADQTQIQAFCADMKQKSLAGF